MHKPIRPLRHDISSGQTSCLSARDGKVSQGLLVYAHSIDGRSEVILERKTDNVNVTNKLLRRSDQTLLLYKRHWRMVIIYRGSLIKFSADFLP